MRLVNAQIAGPCWTATTLNAAMLGGLYLWGAGAMRYVGKANLVRETLNEQPGWRDGKGVSLSALEALIDEWDEDEDEEFAGAVEALAEAGWLVCERDACDEGEFVYCGDGGRA